MRFLASGAAGLCLLASTVAYAESGEELRARGEQLAKDGRYTEAIDAFKAAERLEPRARHACLIALAYTRRELWPQAEIFLEECEKRATPADPAPEWVPMAKQQLAERLATVNVAPVEIVVEPAGVEVKLAVSSFAPDELFDPRTIHLPPGRHIVVATANGYNDAQKTIEIADKTPQQVVITLLPETTPTGPDVVNPLPVPTAAAPSKVPWVMTGVGGALVVVGAVMHVAWFKPARDKLELASDTNDAALYDEWSPRFDTRKQVTIGLYAGGAVAIAAGLVLRYTVFKDAESAPSVAAVPHEGGGMVSVGWSR